MWTYNALKNGLLSDPFQEMNLNLIQVKTALAQMNVKWKSAGEKLNLKSENKDYDWSFDLLLIYWSDIDLILIWYWSWYWSILIGNVRFSFNPWYWKIYIPDIEKKHVQYYWSGLIRIVFFHYRILRGIYIFFYKISAIPCFFWMCLHVFAMVSFKAQQFTHLSP